MRPAVSSSTAQTTGTGARSEGGIESEGDGEEEEEEVMPTEYTEYTEGAGGKGGKRRRSLKFAKPQEEASDGRSGILNIKQCNGVSECAVIVRVATPVGGFWRWRGFAGRLAWPGINRAHLVGCVSRLRALGPSRAQPAKRPPFFGEMNSKKTRRSRGVWAFSGLDHSPHLWLSAGLPSKTDSDFPKVV